MITNLNQKKWTDKDGTNSHSRRQDNGEEKACNHCSRTSHSCSDINTATTTSSINQNYNKTIESKVDSNDDKDKIVTVGNEALLFIYGHNVNLYTDVFELPSAILQQQHYGDNNYKVHSLLLLKQIT